MRGAPQLKAVGDSAAPDPAASALATLTCDAVQALYFATGRTSCPLGKPHEPFMQGGLFEAAVRVQ